MTNPLCALESVYRQAVSSRTRSPGDVRGGPTV